MPRAAILTASTAQPRRSASCSPALISSAVGPGTRLTPTLVLRIQPSDTVAVTRDPRPMIEVRAQLLDQLFFTEEQSDRVLRVVAVLEAKKGAIEAGVPADQLHLYQFPIEVEPTHHRAERLRAVGDGDGGVSY